MQKNTLKTKLLLCLLSFIIFGCKQKPKSNTTFYGVEEIKYAKGLSIKKYDGFDVVTITSPWPNSKEVFQYLFYKDEKKISDSLKHIPKIQVPIQKIIVTSTTHISSLDLLNVCESLVGFPGLNFISSSRVRTLIKKKKIKELGNNQELNTEVVLSLQPDVIMGFAIDNQNKAFNKLEKNGLKLLYNGEWNEKTPLGKAEWIKLFGILYDQYDKADSIFKKVENNYFIAKEIAKKATSKPKILCGAIYENSWFLPQGNSWAAFYIKEANGDYLWKDTNGTGSLSLSFEEVLEKGKNASIWIGPGQYSSLQEMKSDNKNYNYFEAFTAKKVYSFSTKKGPTGGVLFYEMATNRPDLVLKDMIFILHPHLLPDYKLVFFEKLN